MRAAAEQRRTLEFECCDEVTPACRLAQGCVKLASRVAVPRHHLVVHLGGDPAERLRGVCRRSLSPAARNSPFVSGVGYTVARRLESLIVAISIPNGGFGVGQFRLGAIQRVDRGVTLSPCLDNHRIRDLLGRVVTQGVQGHGVNGFHRSSFNPHGRLRD
jgi:hypothetical protein